MKKREVIFKESLRLRRLEVEVKKNQRDVIVARNKTTIDTNEKLSLSAGRKPACPGKNRNETGCEAEGGKKKGRRKTLPVLVRDQEKKH